jgi:dihydrofolate reductase
MTATDAGTRRALGKVVVNRAMSLDGFIAGPGHTMDWVFDYTSPDSSAEVMGATGAMLAGRNTYDVGRRDAGKPSGDAYGGAWSGPTFVLTHRPPADDPSVTFLSGDIRAAVATGLTAADGRDLEVLGTSVAVQCFAHGLVDEIRVYLLPVLLGAGVPLFAPPQPARVELEPVSVTRSGPVTQLLFRVRKGQARQNRPAGGE